MGGAGFQSLSRCGFFRGRSPAYPLFRKEKVHPSRLGNRYDAPPFRFHKCLETGNICKSNHECQEENSFSREMQVMNGKAGTPRGYSLAAEFLPFFGMRISAAYSTAAFALPNAGP